MPRSISCDRCRTCFNLHLKDHVRQRLTTGRRIRGSELLGRFNWRGVNRAQIDGKVEGTHGNRIPATSSAWKSRQNVQSKVNEIWSEKQAANLDREREINQKSWREELTDSMQADVGIGSRFNYVDQSDRSEPAFSTPTFTSKDYRKVPERTNAEWNRKADGL